MRRIHDLRCLSCDRITRDVVVDGDDFPFCGRCGAAQTWVPSKVSHDLWGSPTYVKSLDKEFASRSDLKKFLRANGLQEAGDRQRGAQNGGFRVVDHPKGTAPARRGSAAEVAARVRRS